MKLYPISNADGMTAYSSYVVWTANDGELVACDLIGAETAVKAIAASLYQGKKVDVVVHYSRALRPWGDFKVVRTVLTTKPNLYRWHIVPVVSPDAPAVPVYGWEAVCPASEAVAGALARHTIWPVLPEWASVLHELGWDGCLSTLHCAGVDYALLVSKDGWDRIIEFGIRQGRLKIS